MISRALILIVGLLIFWQVLVVAFALPNYVLPSPLEVFREGVQQHMLILFNCIPTVIEIVLGLLLGILSGVSLALAIAVSKMLRFWLLPLIIMSQAIPTFTIAPLLVLWFGYGMASKIITIVLMLFFPIASTFYDGLKTTPINWLDTAYSLGGTSLRTLWYIQVKAALPNLASGVRLAATIAPIGAIIAEWVGASRGLGYLMMEALARMEIALMFACLLTMMMLALALYLCVDKILARIIYWQI